MNILVTIIEDIIKTDLRAYMKDTKAKQ